MRIKQLYSNFGNHFAEAIAKKYNLNLSNESVKCDEPLFMFGCYDERQLWKAFMHNASGQLTVICWAGSDANNIQYLEVLKNFPRIKHIAISPWIAEDLERMGIPYYRVPVTPHDFSNIKPCALGRSVYMYKPESPVYNGGIYQDIKNKISYNIIEANWGDHTREEMMQIYKRCFIGLRFTEHDGLSNTVCEMGLMGRMVINNGDVPNCIHYDKNNVKDIIEAIDFEWKHSEITDKTEVVSSAVRGYLNIGEDFLNTEYYE